MHCKGLLLIICNMEIAKSQLQAWQELREHTFWLGQQTTHDSTQAEAMPLSAAHNTVQHRLHIMHHKYHARTSTESITHCPSTLVQASLPFDQAK